MANIVQTASEFMLRESSWKRPRITQLNSRLFLDDGPAPKSLVEISGAPDSGKSLLLQQLMAHCLAPTSCGGKNCDIIFLNLSHKFDVKLLAKRLQDMIQTGCKDRTAVELDDLLQKCLDAVQMLSCYTLQDWELALELLDHMLLENNNVALIAVDTLCEFYYLEEREQRIRMYSYYMQCLSRLSQLCKKHHVCCIYTVDRIFSERKSGAASPVAIDYRLQLEHWPDGRRSLNEQPISIGEQGLLFE